MITRIKNSWYLFEQSLTVMSQNKKLLIFPMITFTAMCFIVLFFVGGFILQPTGHSFSDKAHWSALSHSVFTQESLARIEAKNPAARGRERLEFNHKGLVLVTFLYFLSMFFATFFNVAFYHEIIEALKGQPVSLKQGFAFAMSHITPILMWSIFAGLVGYLIRSLEQRVGLIGKIIIRMIGLAWSVAAVFAIPVIVCEENSSNPINVLKSSAQSLRKTWGEGLVGFIGLQGMGILAILSSCVLFLGLGFLGITLHMISIVFCAMLGWVIFIFAFGYVSSVAGNVYQCALYLYASTGVLTPGYTADMFQNAWRFKKSK